MSIYPVTLDGLAAVRDTEIDLTAYLGDHVVFTDSTGKQCIGYIKAADTAEHYE